MTTLTGMDPTMAIKDYQTEKKILEKGRVINGRGFISRYDDRDKLVAKYSFAIPNDEALETLADLAPIVEYGAGTGYWAYRLRAMGVEIIPFDVTAGNISENYYGFDKEWTEIKKPESPSKYTDHTLFLCWPCMRSDWAYRTLKEYYHAGGKRVVYVGEEIEGCTGTKEFHQYLGRNFDVVKHVSIPRWDYIYDSMWVYERKS